MLFVSALVSLLAATFFSQADALPINSRQISPAICNVKRLGESSNLHQSLDAISTLYLVKLTPSSADSVTVAKDAINKAQRVLDVLSSYETANNTRNTPPGLTSQLQGNVSIAMLALENIAPVDAIAAANVAVAITHVNATQTALDAVVANCP